MIIKILNILSDFFISLKNGVTEPFSNLFFDIKYTFFEKDNYENVNLDDFPVEKKKKKKKKLK